VRNYQARNYMRDMHVGDGVLFYHSNAQPPGVAGLARVARVGLVDETQFDPKSDYFDAKAKRDNPRWDCVGIEYVSTFPEVISLDQLRDEPALAGMLVLKKGMRLSVQPVTPGEYKKIVALASRAAKR
jgi:predicted RNA-binding protein with PUA-like domain